QHRQIADFSSINVWRPQQVVRKSGGSDSADVESQGFPWRSFLDAHCCLPHRRPPNKKSMPARSTADPVRRVRAGGIPLQRRPERGDTEPARRMARWEKGVSLAAFAEGGITPE